MSEMVPKIRFQGFTDTWEKQKLSEILQVSKERNKNSRYSREHVLSVSREAGTVNQIEYQGRSFAGADITGYKVVYPGQLIYTKSPLKLAPYGIFQNVTIEGIVSPLYAVYQTTSHSLASFIGLQLKNDNIATHYLSPLVSKGAKNTINITDEGALGGKTAYPSIDEQSKIVNFFATLDSLITLHQRKLDLLKEQKKGFLQKMFPKDGQLVPEVRFVGFTDDWEQRRLGEVVEFFDGKRIPIDSGLRISGEFPYYGATGIIDYVDDYIFDGEYVLLAEDGANITMRNYPVAYLTKGKFWLNNHAHIMKMVNGENYFLVQILEKIDYVKYNTGTAQPKLNSKVVKNIEFKLPKPEEQKVIGSFFKQLDDLITLHQRKLDSLKEQKKGFLQKMFVS